MSRSNAGIVRCPDGSTNVPITRGPATQSALAYMSTCSTLRFWTKRARKITSLQDGGHDSYTCFATSLSRGCSEGTFRMGQGWSCPPTTSHASHRNEDRIVPRHRPRYLVNSFSCRPTAVRGHRLSKCLKHHVVCGFRLNARESIAWQFMVSMDRNEFS